MATAKLDINYIAITEERLREIIREEIKRAVEPGAQRPTYAPVEPWWLSPILSSDTSLAGTTEGTMING